VVSVKNPNLFPKPKPKNAKAPIASGKRVKVLHLSDFHLDPRYYVSSEANCTGGLCCRTNAHDPNLPMGQVSIPAPLYGAFKCDIPYYLGLAALQSIGPLTGTDKRHPFGWSIYTGDLVSHESQNELSRAYTEYAEFSIYDMFKKYITGPVFAVLGNHDSNPEAIDGPQSSWSVWSAVQLEL
jgi:3',5'-cyclic AMP phosphodiesterase CpdA